MENLENEFNEVHALLLKKFREALDDPECKPATLAALSKFLKDNAVVLVPENQDALDEAAEKYADLRGDLNTEDSKHLDFPKQANG